MPAPQLQLHQSRYLAAGTRSGSGANSARPSMGEERQGRMTTPVWYSNLQAARNAHVNTGLNTFAIRSPAEYLGHRDEVAHPMTAGRSWLTGKPYCPAPPMNEATRVMLALQAHAPKVRPYADLPPNASFGRWAQRSDSRGYPLPMNSRDAEPDFAPIDESIPSPWAAARATPLKSALRKTDSSSSSSTRSSRSPRTPAMAEKRRVTFVEGLDEPETRKKTKVTHKARIAVPHNWVELAVKELTKKRAREEVEEEEAKGETAVAAKVAAKGLPKPKRLRRFLERSASASSAIASFVGNVARTGTDITLGAVHIANSLPLIAADSVAAVVGASLTLPATTDIFDNVVAPLLEPIWEVDSIIADLDRRTDKGLAAHKARKAQALREADPEWRRRRAAKPRWYQKLQEVDRMAARATYNAGVGTVIGIHVAAAAAQMAADATVRAAKAARDTAQQTIALAGQAVCAGATAVGDGVCAVGMAVGDGACAIVGAACAIGNGAEAVANAGKRSAIASRNAVLAARTKAVRGVVQAATKSTVSASRTASGIVGRRISRASHAVFTKATRNVLARHPVTAQMLQQPRPDVSTFKDIRAPHRTKDISRCSLAMQDEYIGQHVMRENQAIGWREISPHDTTHTVWIPRPWRGPWAWDDPIIETRAPEMYFAIDADHWAIAGRHGWWLEEFDSGKRQDEIRPSLKPVVAEIVREWKEQVAWYYQ